MKGLVNVSELIVPYLASKHVQPMGLIPVEVRQIPESQRLRKMVQFALWMPFGEEGIYLL